MASLSIPAPHGPPCADAPIPGDKSISHRALMCAAVARGTSTLVGLNRGADVGSTANALRAVGVPIAQAGQVAAVTGVDAFADPAMQIDCGNSGSTMRMLAGLLAGRVDAVLDGDESLRRRPMERVAEPLARMGADVRTQNGRPPMTLRRGAARLRGCRHELAVASAQVKTAILFAALRARGETTIVERARTRDHTERMLAAMGAKVAVEGLRIALMPGTLDAVARWTIPGDFSAAFFFIAGAAVRGRGEVRIASVGLNKTRTAALDVAQQMGVRIEIEARREICGEPVGDLRVRGGTALRASAIDPALVPNLIDEIPALCALAAFAEGELRVSGAAELRAKESDRIAATARLLRSFGAHVEEFADGIAVRGGAELRAPARVATGGDHRIGMTAAVLAAGAQAPIEIGDADCIATSFPGFSDAWRAVFAGAPEGAA